MNLVPTSENVEYVHILAAMFNDCPIDGVVTYSQMQSKIGRNPRNLRYLVSAARRLSNKESGAVFKVVPNVGYQRIRDGVSAGTAALTKARRATKRGLQTVTNWMNKTNLTDEELRRAYPVRTQLSLVAALSARRAAPDLSEVDLSTYRAKDHTQGTLDAIKSFRHKRNG